jgi:DNA-binding FadR family transcriptional regulator
MPDSPPMSSLTTDGGVASAASPPSRIVSLERPDLVSCVSNELQRRIIVGEFASGEPLAPEAELAELFKVSRTVIREAMRNLRSLGLVEVSQGRRPRVRPVDPQATISALGAMLQRCGGSLGSLLEVRRALEGEAAALAAERATAKDLEQLGLAIAEMESAQDDESKLVTADVAFHRGLAQATGNPIFLTILDTLVGLMQEFMRKTYPEFGPRHAILDHRRILEAVQQRDGEAARQALQSHMQAATEYLREVEAKGPSGDSDSKPAQKPVRS